MRSLVLAYLLLVTAVATSAYRDSCNNNTENRGGEVIDANSWHATWREARAARFARDPATGLLAVIDRRSGRQTIYESIDASFQSIEQFRLYRYRVHCIPLPDYLSCAAWNSLVRFTVSYVIAWLNAPDWEESAVQFPLVRVESVDTDDEADTVFAFRPFRDAAGLGAANPSRVWLNVDARFQFTELDNELRPLIERAGLIDAFAELTRRTPRKCEHSFTTTLLHEVMHSFSIGHARNSRDSSAMYPVSYGYAARPPANPQLGGYTISSNDVYRLRDQWGRTTVFLAEEMYENESFLREFDRAFDTKLPAATTTSTTTSTTPAPTTPSSTTTNRPNLDIRDVLLSEKSIDRLAAAIRQRLYAVGRARANETEQLASHRTANLLRAISYLYA